MAEINTGYDVYVLGDVDTSQRLDMLAEKAAEHGAVITQTFAFAPGEAAQHDDLTDVDAVVEALGRAIATRTALWLPFWLQDLTREQHLRRLSLVLQRHGVDLLIGQHMTPCPVHGGINEVDAALRTEVRAVYDLDDAAMAAASMHTLGAEIEAALTHADRQSHAMIQPEERYFSTAEVAARFGKSPQWVSRGLREGHFRYADGSEVEPLRISPGGRRRFSVAMLRAMAWSAYRRGSLSPQQLEEMLADLSGSER